MKNNLWAAPLLSALSLLVFSCEKKQEPKPVEVEQENCRCGNEKVFKTHANVMATYCPTSIWQNLWLSAVQDPAQYNPKHAYLRPFMLSEAVEQLGYTPKHGDRLEIEYTVVENAEENLICTDFEGQKVSICVKKLRFIEHKPPLSSLPNCETKAVVRKQECTKERENKFWFEIEIEGKKQILFPTEFHNDTQKAILQEGDTVKIGYEVLSPICYDGAEFLDCSPVREVNSVAVKCLTPSKR
jgi:hypothetical protein